MDTDNDNGNVFVSGKRKEAGRQTERQGDRQADRKTGRQAGRQAGRQGHMKTKRESFFPK